MLSNLMIDNRENFTWLNRPGDTIRSHMTVTSEVYATTKNRLWDRLNRYRGRILSVSRECCWEYSWLLEFAEDSGSLFRQMNLRTSELEFEQDWGAILNAARKAYWERVDAALIAQGHNVDELFGF